jgi:short-subunit dehydrogenase
MNGNWKNKIAVITGASSGIGAATARRLAREGIQVVLVARRLDRLEELACEIQQSGGQAHTLLADLAQESDRLRVFHEVTERFGNTDVLVNNAGLGWYGYGEQMPWKTAWEMLQVNVEAVVQLSLLFLPGMRSRNSGHIINVGSISGSIPSQGIALYGATKSFMDNFTTALYRELTGTGVHLSVVRAGPVRTEFGEMALAKENGGHVPTEHVGVRSTFRAG